MWRLKLTTTCYCVFKIKRDFQLKKYLEVSKTIKNIYLNYLLNICTIYFLKILKHLIPFTNTLITMYSNK